MKFQRGDIIHQDTPYVASVDRQMLKYVCSCCFSYIDVKPCEHCGYIGYCSEKCQIKDAFNHSIECLVLQQNKATIAKSVVDSESRIVIRALTRWLSEEETGKVTQGVCFGAKRTILDLMTHIDSLNEQELQTALKKAAKIHTFVDPFLNVSHHEVLEMLQRVRINTFAVLGYTCFVEGKALYLGASRFDHTCEQLANYTTVFDGARFILRALKDFEVKHPDEIRVNYVPPSLSLQERQRRLEKSYYFKCKCSQCLSEFRTPRPIKYCPPELGKEIELKLSMAEDNEAIYNIALIYLKKLSDLNIHEQDYYVRWIYIQLQMIARQIGKLKESVYYGLKSLSCTTKSHLTTQSILYNLQSTFKIMGWNDVSNSHHQTYFKCLRLTRKMYQASYGENFIVTKQLKEAEECCVSA